MDLKYEFKNCSFFNLFNLQSSYKITFIIFTIFENIILRFFSYLPLISNILSEKYNKKCDFFL